MTKFEWDLIVEECVHLTTTSELTIKQYAKDEGLNYNSLRCEISKRKNKPDPFAAKECEEVDPHPQFPDMEWPEDIHWTEFFDTWEKVNKQHQAIDPIIETLTIDLSHVKRDISIVSASDLHLGGGFTNHRKLKETMQFIIKQPHMYLGLTGDSIEGFIPGDKPAETQEQMPSSVKAQRSAYRSLVRDLDWKLLWMAWGDHDAKWYEQLIGENIIKQDFHDKIPYFQGRGIIRLLLGEEEYFIQCNHAEMARSQWNVNHPQRRAYEKYFPADVNISGHLHKPAFQMFHHYDMLREMGINLGGEAWLIQNGTFKTGPDVYTIRGWSRGVLGCPTIVFSSKGHDVTVLKTPEKAVRFLRG